MFHLFLQAREEYFDLKPHARSSAIRYHNGTVLSVAKVDADKAYQVLLQRFRQDSNGGSLQDPFSELQRFVIESMIRRLRLLDPKRDSSLGIQELFLGATYSSGSSTRSTRQERPTIKPPPKQE